MTYEIIKLYTCAIRTDLLTEFSEISASGILEGNYARIYYELLSFVCIIDYKEKGILFMNLYSSFRCSTM